MNQHPSQPPDGPRKIDIEFAPEAAPVEIPVRIVPPGEGGSTTASFRDVGPGFKPGLWRITTPHSAGDPNSIGNLPVGDALRRLRDILYDGFSARAGLRPRNRGAGPQEPFDPSVN